MNSNMREGNGGRGVGLRVDGLGGERVSVWWGSWDRP